MKNQKGFSLIELLIVVVIIGIIAAIAIPNLIAARRSANEGSAQSTTRTIHSAQVTYQSTTGGGNFAGLTANTGMANLASAKLVDSTVGAGAKSGYNFDTASLPACKAGNNTAPCTGTAQPASFAVISNPSVAAAGVTQTGTRAFCVSTEGVTYQYKPVNPGDAAPASTMGVVSNEYACTATGGTVVE